MSEIDWSKAPEGATHFSPAFGTFRQLWAKQIDGLWHYHTGVGDWYYGAQPYREEKYIPRPSPAWSGEGLPPVGTVCEWEHEANKGNWHKAEIKYIGSTYVIVADFAGIEQHYYLRSMQFRPIRAAEQIAADEREAAVAEMQRVIAESDAFVVSGYEALYDAGYRKQEVK